MYCYKKFKLNSVFSGCFSGIFRVGMASARGGGAARAAAHNRPLLEPESAPQRRAHPGEAPPAAGKSEEHASVVLRLDRPVSRLPGRRRQRRLAVAAHAGRRRLVFVGAPARHVGQVSAQRRPNVASPAGQAAQH